MAKVNIYKEVLDWSAKLPGWQRDALRRVVTQGQVDEEGIADLASLCKSHYGLADHADAQPLDNHHLPTRSSVGKPVSLSSLTHHAGVNALAPNQTVTFVPGLTVVYGNNGAGKSGYTRILKRACRARGGAEQILGNVTSNAPSITPSATINYNDGNHQRSYRWHDKGDRESSLSRVSVFDRQCAGVYISKPTDVAFRPMGLDLFDHLARICEEVRRVLEKERISLESYTPLLPVIPSGTTVSDLLGRLTSLTGPDHVRNLGTLSTAETLRIDELKVRLHDLTAGDVQGRARELSHRAKIVNRLVPKLAELRQQLSDDAVSSLFDAHETLLAARAKRQSEAHLLESMPLSNTGSLHWLHLWEAARAYSLTDAYSETSFPFVGQDARCVLCQQPLSESGAGRLEELARHAQAASQEEYQRAEHRFGVAKATVEAISVLDESINDAIVEVSFERLELAQNIRRYLETVEQHRLAILKAIENGTRLDASEPIFDVSAITEYVAALNGRSKEILAGASSGAIDTLRKDLDELEARRTLGQNVDVVLKEIVRKQRIAAYEQCIKETRTGAITRKSTDVTQRAVTGQLVAAFAEELGSLEFHHVEVELKKAGGSRGSLYHKLSLTRAPGAEVAGVVSEGEARCLSIASFFAELSTADDPSAILFDDPVSSLDQRWRHNVAKRLAHEATHRQVIVFTHDLVFWHDLLDRAEEIGVGSESRYLRLTPVGAGVLSDKLPTPAMRVEKLIGYLKNLWQEADAADRKGNHDEYESRGAEIYGMLRETWERAVEKILLDGVVERYRPSVQTHNKIMHLASISENDCRTVQRGMSKCSTYLRGHDTSPADNRPFPTPKEIEGDIQALESWVTEIKRRRK